MPHPNKHTDLVKGQVFGNWTVVRESYMKWKKRRYLVRAACCGRESIKQIQDIVRGRSQTCVKCKGGRLPAQAQTVQP